MHTIKHRRDDLPLTPSADAPLVACVDSSPDVVEFLRDLFVAEGFRTAPYTTSPSEGSEKMIAFLAHLRPQVVVYAVSFPYEENWASFQEVCANLPEYQWVVTTTNKCALDQLVGSTITIEIISKPFDLETMVAAVRLALAPRCIQDATPG